MRTIPLNTYKVTFHYTVEVQASHEDDADVLAVSDIIDEIQRYRSTELFVRDMAMSRELIDGVEPGQED